MAGTLFGLPLSQRVDLNGQPSVGWLLYIYQANTSTPVNSYQDTALTVLNPWPIAADASGMMRQFWVADGNYRARATNASGSITYFDQPVIQAIGPSSGAAPSGGVDANAIFKTGDVMWLDVDEIRPGWVRDNGRTIGSSLSGATERAAADCQALFEFLWNKYPDLPGFATVGGGRGASANADWLANKTITTLDKRGLVPGGLDTMGNSSANRWTGISGGPGTTPGAWVGGQWQPLSIAQLPAHSHGISISDPSHGHGLHSTTSSSAVSGAGVIVPVAPFADGNPAGQGATDVAMTGISASAANTGSGDLHENVQLTVLGTFYRKL